MQIPGGNEGDPFAKAYGRNVREWAAGKMREVESTKIVPRLVHAPNGSLSSSQESANDLSCNDDFSASNVVYSVVVTPTCGSIYGLDQRNTMDSSVLGGCGLVTAALAFVKDGQNSGLISPRVAGLFGLPSSFLLYVLMFGISFVTAFLCFRAGARLAQLYRAKTLSDKVVVSN